MVNAETQHETEGFMRRRGIVLWIAMELARLAATAGAVEPPLQRVGAPDPELTRDWPERWERRVLQSARTRYCDTEMGEELVLPFLVQRSCCQLQSCNPAFGPHLQDGEQFRRGRVQQAQL